MNNHSYFDWLPAEVIEFHILPHLSLHTKRHLAKLGGHIGAVVKRELQNVRGLCELGWRKRKRDLYESCKFERWPWILKRLKVTKPMLPYLPKTLIVQPVYGKYTEENVKIPVNIGLLLTAPRLQQIWVMNYNCVIHLPREEFTPGKKDLSLGYHNIMKFHRPTLVSVPKDLYRISNLVTICIFVKERPSVNYIRNLANLKKIKFVSTRTKKKSVVKYTVIGLPKLESLRTSNDFDVFVLLNKQTTPLKTQGCTLINGPGHWLLINGSGSDIERENDVMVANHFNKYL